MKWRLFFYPGPTAGDAANPPSSFSARGNTRRITNAGKQESSRMEWLGRGVRSEGASYLEFIHGFWRNGFHISCKRLDLTGLASPRLASAGPWRAGKYPVRPETMKGTIRS